MIGRVDENNREWKSERKGRKESIELRGGKLRKVLI